jgi:uncharacterized protein (TIGR04255 family)
MPFDPAHEAHAIDRVSASVLFGPTPPLTTTEWLPVLMATHAIAQDVGFGTYQEGMAAQFSLNNEPGIMASATTNVHSLGAGFRLADQEGRPLAEFMAFRGEIRVDVFAYVRWNGFCDLLRSILPSLIERYPKRFIISQAKLEYWDRFESPNARSPWSDLFQGNHRLPPWVLTQPDNWHVHMGWFETGPDGKRRLLNLNVDNIDARRPDGQSIQTSNVYTLAVATNEALPAADSMEPLFTSFEDLHDASKQAVASVLTLEMQKRISLFAEPEEA